VIFAPAFTFEL